jgi:hypothetical protein
VKYYNTKIYLAIRILESSTNVNLLGIEVIYMLECRSPAISYTAKALKTLQKSLIVRIMDQRKHFLKRIGGRRKEISRRERLLTGHG